MDWCKIVVEKSYQTKFVEGFGLFWDGFCEQKYGFIHEAVCMWQMHEDFPGCTVAI